MSLEPRQFLASSSLAADVSAFAPRALAAFAPQAAQAPPETSFVPVRGTVGIFNGQGGTVGRHIDKTRVVAHRRPRPADV
jgi:hypothetical protein